jgi:ABC-type glycerol-3-phosphate transport system permease component
MPYFRSIPRSIEDSAMVDGLSNWTIFRKVIAPLAAPALLTVGIYTFINVWSEFLFALFIIRDFAYRTLPFGLYDMLAGRMFAINYELGAAGMILSAIPTIGLYLLFQKYMIRGVGAIGFAGR